MESGALIGTDEKVIHWHLPPGRTVASLPDSPDLWQEIWSRRDVLLGVAHSHPGGGTPGPSPTDITTFSAIELGLGRRLTWWITSANACVVVKWIGPDKYKYGVSVLPREPDWADALREMGQPQELPKEVK